MTIGSIKVLVFLDVEKTFDKDKIFVDDQREEENSPLVDGSTEILVSRCDEKSLDDDCERSDEISSFSSKTGVISMKQIP